MKKLYLTICISLLTLSTWSQSPEKISYQAVVRDSKGDLVANTEIGMEISIIKGSTNGTVIYTETQNPTSNSNGLVSIEIGGPEAIVELGNFSSVNWSDGIYFIRTKTDPTGGANYTITGTSQLLSVPYALHAKSAETITGPIVEIDGSITNEIQDLQLDSNILIITNNEYATEIDLSKYVDEKITISAGDGIVITGTYPNFVVSQSTKHYIGELIGENGEDGIVFWVDHTGEHGLICSPVDLNDGITVVWSDIDGTVVPGGAKSKFDGYSNTIAINNQSKNSAAGLCLNYSTPGTSPGDWYLPAVEELSKIYHVKYEINKALNIDNFGYAYYWSSTELSFNYAWYYHLEIGYSNNNNKHNAYMVRAIRAF